MFEDNESKVSAAIEDILIAVESNVMATVLWHRLKEIHPQLLKCLHFSYFHLQALIYSVHSFNLFAGLFQFISFYFFTDR